MAIQLPHEVLHARDDERRAAQLEDEVGDAGPFAIATPIVASSRRAAPAPTS
jgi:hypothetical protein